LAEAPQSLEKNNFKCFNQLGSAPVFANEHEDLRILDLNVKAFVNQLAKALATPKSWNQLLESRLGSYGGPVLTKARKLTLGQIVAGLHDVGMSAQVDAHWLATGFVKMLLADPSKQ